MAADPQPTPFEQLLEDEQQGVAAELISALPDDSREVLLLYYREGQSSQQVATLLGLSDAAVRKRLSRARQVVRDELLQRFGEFAHDSAPSFAFSSVVATALAVASPPAAASILGSTAAVGATTLGKILLGSAGSLGLALVAGFAGIYLGLRQQLKGSVDQEERHGLIRSSVISGLASIGFLVVLLGLTRLDDGWVLPMVATLGFMGAVFYQAIIVQPRILARRRAREALRDPVAAARRRRRERWLCWVGGTAGFVGGFGGLIYALIVSGRL